MTKGTNVKLRMSASMDAYTECFSFRQPTVCRMQYISLHIKECVTALKVHWPTWFICGSNEAFTHHALSFWPKLKQTAVCSPASSYVQSVGVICTYKSNKRHAHAHNGLPQKLIFPQRPINECILIDSQCHFHWPNFSKNAKKTHQNLIR